MASPEVIDGHERELRDSQRKAGVTHGIYYAGMSGEILHQHLPLSAENFTYDYPTLPAASRLEHLAYREFTGSDVPDILSVADIHPDEEPIARTVTAVWRTVEQPHIEAHIMHNLAAVLGRREYIVPVDGQYALLPERERILMDNYRESDPSSMSAAKGRRIDLNRQFTLPEGIRSFDAALRHLESHEAQMALSLVHDHPRLRIVISHHMDVDRLDRPAPDGFYFYDTPWDARTDTEHTRVLRLVKRLRRRLKQFGYGLYTGIDDPSDPDLGYMVDDGYVYQPIIDIHGNRRPVCTFEGAAAEMGRLGLSGIRRSFTLEFPMRMSPSRQWTQTALVYNEFLFPYLETDTRMPLTPP